MNFTTEGRDEIHEEIPADIADNCFIPECCDDVSIEIVEEIVPSINGKKRAILHHVCTNCGSARPELD